MKANEIINALKLGFNPMDPTAFAWCDEFRPSLGWSGERRRLDTWAIHLSPARGMNAHAFEIKISRADWLKELKQPLKRRMGLAVSNYFWMVAPPGIIKPEELPFQIGLLEVNPIAEDRFGLVQQIHPADYRDKVRPTWALVAAVIQKISKK